MRIHKTTATFHNVVEPSGHAYRNLNITILIFITLKPTQASSGKEKSQIPPKFVFSFLAGG